MKSRNVMPLALFLLIALAIQSLFWFHAILRIVFFYFFFFFFSFFFYFCVKTTLWFWKGLHWLYRWLWILWMFYNINYSDPQTWDTFPFAFSTSFIKVVVFLVWVFTSLVKFTPKYLLLWCGYKWDSIILGIFQIFVII